VVLLTPKRYGLDKIKIVLGDDAKGAQPDQITGIETETQGAHYSLGGVFYIGNIGNYHESYRLSRRKYR
jgi:hypothetical protein